MSVGPVDEKVGEIMAKQHELIKRAGELLNDPAALHNAGYMWAMKAVEWLKDSGMKKSS